MQKDPSCLLGKKEKKKRIAYSALCLQPATTTMKPWGFNFLSWILPGVKARWSQTARANTWPPGRDVSPFVTSQRGKGSSKMARFQCCKQMK